MSKRFSIFYILVPLASWWASFGYAATAPYSFEKIRSILSDSKLQALITLIEQGVFHKKYNPYFYGSDNCTGLMIFAASGYKKRSELRQINEWYRCDAKPRGMVVFSASGHHN